MFKISLVNNFISTSIKHEVYAAQTIRRPLVRAIEKDELEFFERNRTLANLFMQIKV